MTRVSKTIGPKVITRVTLRILNLKFFVETMGMHISSLVLKQHNKMDYHVDLTMGGLGPESKSGQQASYLLTRFNGPDL